MAFLRKVSSRTHLEKHIGIVKDLVEVFFIARKVNIEKEHSEGVQRAESSTCNRKALWDKQESPTQMAEHSEEVQRATGKPSGINKQDQHKWQSTPKSPGAGSSTRNRKAPGINKQGQHKWQSTEVTITTSLPQYLNQW
jgi:hypothetical protein